ARYPGIGASVPAESYGRGADQARCDRTPSSPAAALPTRRSRAASSIDLRGYARRPRRASLPRAALPASPCAATSSCGKPLLHPGDVARTAAGLVDLDDGALQADVALG